MNCTINPFIAYIDLLIAQHTGDPSTSYTDLMTTSTMFEVVGDDCDVCSSDCGNFAFLGPVLNSVNDKPLALCFTMMGAYNFPRGCCENYDISSIHSAVIKNLPDDSSKNYQSELCCNSFNNCAPAFTNLMQKYLFTNPIGHFDQYSFGIHEYGTIKGDSSLCLLNAKIQAFSDADKLDFLNGFYIAGGLVAFNNGSTVYAGTTLGFLNWW